MYVLVFLVFRLCNLKWICHFLQRHHLLIYWYVHDVHTTIWAGEHVRVSCNDKWWCNKGVKGFSHTWKWLDMHIRIITLTDSYLLGMMKGRDCEFNIFVCFKKELYDATFTSWIYYPHAITRKRYLQCTKTTHGTKKMWSYIAGGLKIKVINTEKCPLGPNQVVL